MIARVRRIWGLATGLALPGVVIPAQPVRVTPLRAANATLPDEFTTLRAGRELTDGRLLVVDIGEKRVGLVDWRIGAVANIGRVGDGPGEYRSPSALIPLSRDSTLLTDSGTRRWFVLVGGRIVRTLTADMPLNRELGSALVGGDTSGHLLAVPANSKLRLLRTREMVSGVSSERVDSLELVLASRVTSRLDTVGRLRSASLRQKRAIPRHGEARITWVLQNPLDVDEHATLFADAWIAVARLDPYRVDWRRPDGMWVRGAPIEMETVRVDDRQQRAAIAREFPGQSPPMFEPGDFPEWPKTLPPFSSRHATLLASPDGRVIVQRTPTSDGQNRYDIIDRKGQLVGFFLLPRNEALLTVGAQSAYVVVTDNDGSRRCGGIRGREERGGPRHRARLFTADTGPAAPQQLENVVT